jgi:DNA-binding transcriptional ArsR family regulator
VREGPGRHVVVQHLAVLREADLVRVEPQGRRRVNHLNPVPIQQILQRWVSRYEANWVAALVGLKDTVEHPRGAREEKGEDVG